MFTSPERLIEAATLTVQNLRTREDLPAGIKAELEIVATSLLHAQKLAAADAPAVGAHACEAVDFLVALLAEIDRHPPLATLRATADRLLSQARVLANANADANAADAAPLPSLLALLHDLDDLLAGFVNAAPQAAQAFLANEAIPMLAWLGHLNELGVVDPRPQTAAQPRSAVKVDDLQALLQQRLQDPSILVKDWTPLQGGYGKETNLFRVEGDKVQGEFVMRRDVDASLISGLDCHDVKDEFKLLQAVYARGFPMAEPVLLETDSATVRGPDFIIVRRMPGKVEGDITGGQGKVDAPVQATLARVTAQIHNLEPISELGGQIRELRPSLWGMSTGECVRNYIKTWYDFYIAKKHVPVPAVHGMFNWLFNNVPESVEPATLVHGDIGLHNLLFHEGKLSAVLDWEFSHVGDPAEDIGYISIAMGQQLDWEVFLDEYCKAGRPRPDRSRIKFYEIWALVRNFSTCNIAIDLFARGELEHARYAMIPAYYNPYYVNRIHQLMGDWKNG